MMFADELEMQTDLVQREECILGGTTVQIPQELCEKEELLTDVLTLETCEKVLTNDHWTHLMKFLPSFPENDDAEKQNTIRQLLSGENFKFGNPVQQFHKRLRDGDFSTNMEKMTSIIRRSKQKDYRYQQQRYYFKLLQEILISRKKLLKAASKLPPDHPIKMERLQTPVMNNCIEQQTKKRYFRELQEVREEVNELATSSEDENYPEGSPPKLTKKQKKQMFHYEAALSPDMARISSTTSPNHSNLENGGNCSSHSVNPFEVTEEYYRELLLRHKKRRHEKEEHPDLDTMNITLQEVVMRTSMIKRTSPRPATSEITGSKKKGKEKEKLEKRKKKIKPTSAIDGNRSPTPDLGGKRSTGTADMEKVKIKVEDSRDHTLVDVDAFGDDFRNKSSFAPNVIQDTFVSFFSLIRDIICKSPDQRIAAPKLEEEIRAWQESPFASLNEWFNQQINWSEQVVSMLKFLAGDFPGVHSDSFVPYIDYKEKIQMWQWIGVGRDSDENMASLCKMWLESKDEASISETMDTITGSPPPARILTEWMVRPTSEDERTIYREQEQKRYENPHKAFTFRMHDYESVVGPVKGVYGKDGAMNKAREHSLLVSDRPPFVTILSLVRDAAARLPNGEGTRADICELLKDSQYLSVTADSQVHTVVSGALDRLHYEKDPCVKYDVNRKLWIYLHRNRTEEEFERIHQAHAAAAKAKKSVHKPKVSRTSKNKELSRPASAQSPVLIDTSSLLDSSTATILPSTAVGMMTSGHTLRGSGSASRAQQNSPKTTVASMKTSRIAQSMSPKTNVATSLVIPQGNVATVLPQTQVAATRVCTASSTSLDSGTTCQVAASAQPFILPQSHSGSRPSSTGSAQSLPSPKAVIANVNAQFVSVSQVQIAPGAISPKMIPSPTSSTQTKTVSNLLSQQQQQALQQIVAKQQQHHHHHQVTGALKSATMVNASTHQPTVKLLPSVTQSDILLGKPNPIISSTIGQPSLHGLQTIMIKQEPGTTAQILNAGGGNAALSSTVANSVKTNLTSGNKPVVARIISSPQVVSMGNLIASTLAATHKQVAPMPGTTTIKIQGGNIMQRPNVGGKPGGMNVIQASPSGTGLPRLAVVTQGTAGNLIPVTCSTATAQPKLLATASGQLGVMTSSLCSSSQITTGTKPTFLTTTRGMKILSAATSGMSLAQFGAKPGVVVTTKANSSAALATNATTTVPSNVILTGGVQTTNPTVVIASQGTIKPAGAQTVVMAATNTAQTVVMTSGMRPVAAVTPVNMKALQGVKVIPVSQAQGSKGKAQPVFARIITPPAGLTLQSCGALTTPQQGISVIQSVAGTQSSTYVRSVAAPNVNNPLATTPTTIIRLQASANSEAETSKDKC